MKKIICLITTIFLFVASAGYGEAVNYNDPAVIAILNKPIDQITAADWQILGMTGWTTTTTGDKKRLTRLLAENIKKTIQANPTGVSDNLKAVVNNIIAKNTSNITDTDLNDLVAAAGGATPGVSSGLLDTIKQYLNTIPTSLEGMLSGLMTNLQGMLSGVMTSLEGMLSGVMTSLEGMFASLKGMIGISTDVDYNARMKISNDISKLRIAATDYIVQNDKPPSDPSVLQVEAAIMKDPWNRDYVFEWSASSLLIYSAGPKGNGKLSY